MKRLTNVQRAFLFGGVISAPLFYLIVIAQVLTRTGFDIRRHAISSLELGDAGWIQSVNFVVTGVLAVLAAIGVRNLLKGSKGGTWGPLLIGVYGVGMMMAGIFPPDPGLGFPSGAPEGMPTSMSVSAALHSAAFFIAFIGLIAATIVFASRFAFLEENRWRIYCIATAVIAPLLFVLGTVFSSWVGVIMAFAGVVAFGWVSVLTNRLRIEAS
jgi:hypothetical protein